MSAPSATAIWAHFAHVYAQLLRTPFDPSLARPDYTNPAAIARILAALEECLPAQTLTSPVPRRIFMLWQQGWDAAPPLVRACAQSWAERNPGWELVLLDDKTLGDWAPDHDRLSAPIAARTGRSNIARLNLLQTHGGVWADATLYCSRPLDDWLGAVTQKGVFTFAGPRPYRPCEIWFMAGSSGHPLLSRWLEAMSAYWRLPVRPGHYYWTEFLLGLVLKQDRELASLWADVPQVPPHGPEIVAANRFDAHAPREVFGLIEAARVPVHKLSHKWPYEGQDLSGTPVAALTGLTRL